MVAPCTMSTASTRCPFVMSTVTSLSPQLFRGSSEAALPPARVAICLVHPFSCCWLRSLIVWGCRLRSCGDLHTLCARWGGAARNARADMRALRAQVFSVFSTCCAHAVVSSQNTQSGQHAAGTAAHPAAVQGVQPPAGHLQHLPAPRRCPSSPSHLAATTPQASQAEVCCCHT